MRKIALICGVSGQDGAYLAKLLLSKGYDVWGTSRDAQGASFSNLKYLNIKDKVKFISMDPVDFRSVFVALLKSEPDEVYYLSGQSSVGLSFEQPVETIQSITIGTLNMLEACKMIKKDTKVYFAGSSECFGDTKGKQASEETPFNPQSPYAVAKSSAKWLVDNYRNAYDLYVCTGLLFNHESPLRSERFVTQKIIKQAKEIAKGTRENITLGRLDISRDWGWAPEYVEAMWLMLQQDKAEDYVIATGETNTLEKFVKTTFEYFSLDWKQYVTQNKEFLRPTDINLSVGNPSKANIQLDWQAKTKLKGIVDNMINTKL